MPGRKWIDRIEQRMRGTGKRRWYEHPRIHADAEVDWTRHIADSLAPLLPPVDRSVGSYDHHTHFWRRHWRRELDRSWVFAGKARRAG